MACEGLVWTYRRPLGEIGHMFLLRRHVGIRFGMALYWTGLTGGLLARLVMLFFSGAILKIVWYGVLRFGLDLTEAAWRGWLCVSFPGAILETWFGMAC